MACSIAASVRDTCERTSPADSLLSAGCDQVWFCTDMPASCSALTMSGNSATCRPIVKKVATASYRCRMSRICWVDPVSGPSSNV